MEAGEKNYECTFKDCKRLSKNHAQFKNKSRVKYLRHLKIVHDVMLLELLDLELGDLFNFKEFCVKQRDAMLDGLIEKWEPPVVAKPHRQLEPELVQLEDSFEDVRNEEEYEEIKADEVEASNCAEDSNQEYETEVMDEDFGRKEESNMTSDVNVVSSKRRNRGEFEGEEETEFTCQICDQTFQQGLAVSLHMFQDHLKGLTSVWEPLVKPASPAAFPHSWTCNLCSQTFPTRTTAQLHIYTESEHKRRLKHSMEDRRENWQHTLEFVRFKIPVENILEDDDEHVGDEEMVTSSTVEGVTHNVEAAEAGEMPIHAKNASAITAGEVPAQGGEAYQLGSEPDHLELDYEPEDEDNSNGDALFLAEASNEDGGENVSNSVQCRAADQVKEGGREEEENIDRAAFKEGKMEDQGISCSHFRGGCAETFASMIELHNHARKCRFRPSKSFQCSTPACGNK